MRRILLFCALIFAVSVASAATAGAQQSEPGYPGTPPTDVEGEVVDNDGADDDETDEQVLGDVTTRQPAVAARSGGGLPVTGGDVAGLAAIGAGAILLGATMVMYRRRLA